MATDIVWVAIGIAGAVGGVSYLVIRLIDRITKPKLAFSTGPSVGTWTITIDNTTNTWKFVNFEVISKRGLAIGCEAKAIIIKHPDDVTIFEEFLKQGCGLHWADVQYSGRSTSVDRVDIGSTPQRLDVVFTVPTHSGQSYLAMPIALSSLWDKRGIPTQATLRQGEYILKIKLSCANGRGDTKTIRLVSPDNWENLKAEEIKGSLLRKHKKGQAKENPQP